ncbi:MAG: TatD family hydrolase [candidate division Zixibacteria bacterium]|nr:TatD family hydrolase [candidate division Zixibacteria bacterium]
MIDSHCHLDFKDFDSVRDQMVAEAREAGVHTIVNIGVDLETSKRSVALAEKYDMIYATVGVHPHDAKTWNENVEEELMVLAIHEKVKAVGEIGLDFYRDNSPRPAQRKAFYEQLKMATKLKLPVVIHTREAFGETLDIVKEFAPYLTGGVFHCFPGDIDDAYKVFELGFIISVGGVITFRNSRMSRVATEVPLEKIMLETDAPYIAPEPFRGKMNHPAFVVHSGRKLAELKKISYDEVEKITDRTTRKFFKLVETFEG